MKILNCSLDDGAVAIHVGSPLSHEVRHEHKNQNQQEKCTKQRDHGSDNLINLLSP